MTGESDALLRTMARYHLAEVDWLTGKLTDSEREMSAILAEWANSDEWLVLLRVGLDLGAVQRAQGRLGAALNTYRRLESKAGTTASALAGMAQVGAAIVFYERDELAEAAAQAAAGVERCRRLVYGPPLVTGLITLARIRLALGDPAGAHAAITEAETAMPGIGDQRVPLGPRRAEVMLATGNVAEAVNWVRDRGLAVDDEPVYPRDEAYAVLARVLIATGDPAPVVPMLERWRVVAEAQGRVAHVLAGQVLQAVAHAALGTSRRTGRLARALTLAAPEGYLRLFLNEGAVVADLLRTLLIGRRLESLAAPEKVPRAFLTRLGAAFERQGTPVLPAAPSGAVAAPGLVVPLSRREQEVLGLVAAGKPEPGHRPGAVHRPGHRQAARQPPLRQAGRQQPHRSRGPRPCARSARLTARESHLRCHFGGTSRHRSVPTVPETDGEGGGSMSSTGVAHADVVVVGAGPTGLMLAGDLAEAGVRVTVLERRARESNVTRAFAVHARTMEELQIRGVADELAASGTTIQALRLYGRASIDLERLPSAFHSLLITPQFQTERVLTERLDRLGVSITHDAEVVGVTQDAAGVEVRARASDGGAQRRYRAAYAVGTDGVRSAVRKALGLPFPGSVGDPLARPRGRPAHRGARGRADGQRRR